MHLHNPNCLNILKYELILFTFSKKTFRKTRNIQYFDKMKSIPRFS